MGVHVAPAHPALGGVVTGVDLRGPLDAAEVAAIQAAIDRFGMLVFPGQDLTDEQQIAFTRNFGELENYRTSGHVRPRSDSRLGAGISDFSNLDKHGQVLSPEDRVWLFKLGDRLWHSDSSFRPVPASYSLLSARALPSWGGNTEFADTRLAYDTLDARTRALVERLVCRHSLMFSREAIGFSDLTDADRAAFAPVRQPLVRMVNGRKALFLSSHAGEIEGWTVPEARDFLRELTEHATRPEVVYAHQWQVHDLVMWDNRVTLHRARRFDRLEVRDMRRTTVGGDAPLIAQAG